MGLGDAPLPVASSTEVNNPVPPITRDTVKNIDSRLKVMERSPNGEVIRQIKYLYDLLSEPYPPP